jgi:hypothetical protein
MAARMLLLAPASELRQDSELARLPNASELAPATVAERQRRSALRWDSSCLQHPAYRTGLAASPGPRATAPPAPVASSPAPLAALPMTLPVTQPAGERDW